MSDETKAASMNLTKRRFISCRSVKRHKVYIRSNDGLVRVMTLYDTPWWGLYCNIDDEPCGEEEVSNNVQGSVLLVLKNGRGGKR